MRRRIVAGLLALAACAGGPPSEGGAFPLTSATREERLTIGAHNEVLHVSAGERLVFAASRRGVITYDALFRGWLPPLEMDEARGAPTVFAADPTEDAVWIGSAGRVVYYRPRIDYAITTAFAGTPQEIFFDRRDPAGGAFVRVGASFVRINRTGGSSQVPLGALPAAPDRLGSATGREVLRAYPALEASLPLLTRDEDLEQWPVSSAAASPGRSEVWLGTRGNGLLRVDPVFNRAEHLPFGLLEPGVGALALAADGVWIGGIGAPGERGGLVFASADLQRWRWVDGPPSRPFVGTRVNALSIRDRTAWVGTNRGLIRVRIEADDRIDRWDAMSGLPSDVVTSVAAGDSGAWVGTLAGLAWVDRAVRVVTPRIVIRDILLWTDTLWIASNGGLLGMASSDSAPRRLTIGEGRLDRDIAAIARADSVLVVATGAELIEIDLLGRRVLPPRAASVAALQRITRVAMDARTIWLAGEGGVLVLDRASGRSTLLATGLALSAPATSVALGREVAWIGTLNGLVRVRRRSDGMPP